MTTLLKPDQYRPSTIAHLAHVHRGLSDIRGFYSVSTSCQEHRWIVLGIRSKTRPGTSSCDPGKTKSIESTRATTKQRKSKTSQDTIRGRKTKPCIGRLINVIAA